MTKISNLYDNVDIKDDFMFCTVMKNSRLCKQFLERVLGISIKEIRYVETQKTYNFIDDAKSIRLDVYANDNNGTVYDIEMQKCNTSELPKRSRYYSGLVDMDLIEKGQPYRMLPKNIILFVCDFDPFKPHNKSLYCFENKCIDDPTILLNDGTMKVFVNIKGDLTQVSDKMSALLKFMDIGEVSDEFTASLKNEVNIVKNNTKWRLDYMTLQDKLDERYEQGKIEFAKALILSEKLTIEEASDQLGISVEQLESMIEVTSHNNR